MPTHWRLGGLWRHPDFMKLWAGQTISVGGTAVTDLALPLTAVLTLKASPAQMGALSALEVAPYLLVSLFAGVWVDRLRRRPVLIAADLGRAGLLASIPIVALLGRLGLAQLYTVAFVVGALSVIFNIAYQSFLPSVVARDHLVEGNGKLALSASVGQVAGPGVGGALVQVLTAPVAIAVDALSYVASAMLLAEIHAPEPVPRRSGWRRDARAEIGEGLRAVAGQPVLRVLVGAWSVYEFSAGLLLAVLLLYLTRDLGLAPALLGAVFMVGSVSGIVGAALTGWFARRLGLGLSIAAALAALGLGGLCLPLAGVFRPVELPLVVLGQILSGVGLTVSGSNQTSLRQAVTPERLRGRVNASYAFLTSGVRPFGALLGGVLGQRLGVPATLTVGALGILVAAAWILSSPIRAIPTPPVAEPDPPSVSTDKA
jgi:MFS family permease